MNKNITIGILAHVDAGKTTLSEALLYTCGAIRKLGRVDHKDAFLDTYELERSRGITIFSKQAIFEYQDTTFTLLDTPGHADFSPEMERTLQILDMAVLIISAADKVTSQVKLLWKLLSHYQVPTLIFVNKMDQPGADKKEIMDALRDNLTSHCICFDAENEDPSSSLSLELQEELAVCDDDLLEAFLEGKEMTNSEIKQLINSRKCFPCIFGSALKTTGVQKLLDLLSDYSDSKQNDVSDDDSFSARIYKISRDIQGTRLTHIKIISGRLRVRDQIHDEKVDQMRIYNGEKYENLQEACKGMVVAVTGLSSTRSGEGLGALSGSVQSEVIQPILSCSLILPDDTDTVSFYRKLKGLEEEEPMLLVSLQGSSDQIQVQIMGDVQKEILTHLIKTRFGIDVKFGPGHIVYKETIADTVEGVGHFEPLRHYAEVHLLLEPAEPGSGISFHNKCSTDVLSLNWQRLILTHLQEKKHLGVLTGSELTDVKITLLTGKAHEKHTEGGDFRQATYRAVRQGLMQAHSVLLEPVLNFRIEVPQENIGRVLNDIQKMYGNVGLPDIINGKSVLTGTIPAACLSDYAQELKSFTKGEGSISTTLSGYAPCHNTEEVLEEKNYYPEFDTENPSSSVFCSHGAGTLIPWDEVYSYMHLENAWSSEKTSVVKTDLTDNIDMDALKKLQSKSTKKSTDDRSFDEIQRDLTFTENELKDIFERTYGTIKPRYVETPEERRRYEEMKKASLDEQDVPKPNVTLSAKKLNSKKDERLAERQKEYLLVDGYNVIYSSDELKSLAATDLKAARDKLTDILINFQGYRRENVILVFDAYKVRGGSEHIEQNAGLTIIYTKEAETADQYIEKAANEIGKKYRVTVATSDAIEQIIVMSSGAIRLSARDFWEEVKRTENQIREHF
ncbi:translation factor GTPase family protein [Butyrivibrio sp. YAB3001]|uniref:translation factor GTPase family protein n=1 Tax=Butyrivibrio sp. YAB3001 TaxID=1520812 RepID=UPI0008F68FC2|nr:TetM/TetW/TetO/TetS family tetracycline resistance ribosomal protection protein [Butyrivibrio sp. YAB3001]SFC40389.1 small GTP-binding protein domain-containing protein [Butyrivibrio sp. YAB3001]